MSKKHTAQRWVVLSDMHVGSKTGLTSTPSNPVQRQLVARWEDARRWYGAAPDVVLVNGDAIDGQDRHARDIDENYMIDQAQKAAELLFEWGAKREYIIRTGTRYHVSSDGEEMERFVVSHLQYLLAKAGRKVKVTFGRKLKTTINGWFVLEARHKIGRSSIPHGRGTAPARSKMWNVLNAALSASRGRKPVQWPHLIVYSHVHYWHYTEDAWGAVCTLPGWQAIGSKFGDEECSGHIDIGLLGLEVGATKEVGWSWEKRLYQAAVVDRTEHR